MGINSSSSGLQTPKSNGSSESDVPMDEFAQEIEDRIATKLVQKQFQIRKMKRLNIFMHVVLCFVC